MFDAARPNLSLEALAFFGAHAGGHTPDWLENRLLNHGIKDLTAFRRRCEPLRQLDEKLLPLVPEERTLRHLFSVLDGFPGGTLSSHSPVFLLLYPLLGAYPDDLRALLTAATALPPQRVAQNLLVSLDLADEPDTTADDPQRQLARAVASLDVPAQTRTVLLSLPAKAPEVLREAAQYLLPVADALRENEALWREACVQFSRELDAMGREAFLRQTSSLDPAAAARYCLCPLLLAPDTNLSLPPSADGSTLIYCGVLRPLLRRLLDATDEDVGRVYEMIRVLADPNRFDILCYLNRRTAYGQELCEHFSLARNTIHHHMSKLTGAGLVTCCVKGNRVYYTADRERLQNLLQLQSALLLG